jgi:mRNA interferase HigB
MAGWLVVETMVGKKGSGHLPGLPRPRPGREFLITPATSLLNAHGRSKCSQLCNSVPEHKLLNPIDFRGPCYHIGSVRQGHLTALCGLQAGPTEVVEKMRVISRKRLVKFGEKHPQAATPLDAWYRIMKAAKFAGPQEVAAQFGSQNVSFLGGELTVFDISGNNVRLVAAMVYDGKAVYVKHVFTHAEYDKWNKKRR